MDQPLRIGSRREVLWDDALIVPARTTARLTLHAPQPREVVILHDAPWEGDGCDYHCIVKDGDRYRMYYLAWNTQRPDIRVAYAESRDGLRWEKPELGLCEFAGSRQNNILLDRQTAKFDNFAVFIDGNPACPPEERYKGVALDGRDKYLWCFTSADGIRFQKAWQMTNQGKFDSLNIAFWDAQQGQYWCYLRDFHDVPGNDLNAGIRDIRWMTSPDFRTWTTPVRLDFGAGDDLPLYTNVIHPYYRAEHVYTGFPSRYIEKSAWTGNFDQLAGAARRRQRMAKHARYGLAITDCLFMCSRDGQRWHRFDEAFMRPGPEREYNWVYGDCYPALGLIETPSDLPHAPPELSLYAMERHWSGEGAPLRRYTLRVDGFASYRATWRPCTLTLKPLNFTGRRLSLNFSTSAAGSIVVTLHAASGTRRSIELFGDSLDRTVVFPEGDLADLAGQPVTLEFAMRDADLYSFRFDDGAPPPAA